MLRLRLALVAGVLIVAAVVVLVRHGGESVPSIPGAGSLGDPYAWTKHRSDGFERRATQGTAHALYTRSPGGAVATAARVARWRKPIEAAAKAAGVDPDRLEALVFLESGGREDAQAPGGVQSAAGLTQILAQTATGLLGMKVDTARSASYTRRLNRAIAAGKLRRAAALSRARKRVDDRFDATKALAGTARYLTLARKHFGREDLAFESYHMGIGNLDGVLRAYGGGPRPYVQLYFDSTPLRHPAAQQKLAGFGDDSSNYYWKLGAAMEMMRLARTDRARLARLAALQTGDRSARGVLLAGAPHGDPVAARSTTAVLVRTGLQLRPEALATALYMGAQVQAIAHAGALRVTAAEDGGWTFRVSRRYASHAQALAFQYVLDRLQVLNVIAWSRDSRSIHVTVAPDAKRLEPLLDRVGGRTP